MLKEDAIQNKTVRRPEKKPAGAVKRPIPLPTGRGQVNPSEIENKQASNEYLKIPDGYRVAIFSHYAVHREGRDFEGNGSAFIGVVTQGVCNVTSANGTTAQIAAGQVFGFNNGLEIAGGAAAIIEVMKPGFDMEIKPFIADPVSDAGKTRDEKTRVGHELVEGGTLRADMIYLPIGGGNYNILTGISACAREKNNDIFPLVGVLISGEILTEKGKVFSTNIAPTILGADIDFSTPHSDARIIVFSIQPE